MRLPTIILFIFFWATAKANSNETNGLIFTETGKVHLTFSTWRICYYFDLEEYYKEKDTLRVIINRMDTICNQLSEGKNCNILVNYLRQEYGKMLYEKNNIISRSKRAVLPSVGKILNVLFGVMDDDEAKKYEEKTNEIVKEVNVHNDILDEQTTMIMKTIRSSNETLHEFQKKISEIAIELKSKTLSQNKIINEVSLRESINFLSEIATLIIMDHRDLTNKINNLVRDTTTGEIADIIDVSAIKKDLSIVRDKLEKGEDFPIDLNGENIFEIFTYSRVKARVTEKSIFIEISVPIIEDRTFKFFEITPLPIIFQNEVHLIVIKSKHILANLDTGEVIEMDDSDHCFGRNGNICQVHSAITTDSTISCEAMMLLNEGITGNVCETKKIPRTSYVIPISQTNGVYIFPSSKLKIKNICKGKNPEVFTLTEPEIIEMQPKCKLMIGSFRLQHHETNIYNASEIKSAVELNKIIFDETIVKPMLEPKTILIDDNKIFEGLRQSDLIQKFEHRNKHKIEEINLRGDSHTYGILGVLGISIIIIAIVLYVFIKKILPIAATLARIANPVPIPL